MSGNFVSELIFDRQDYYFGKLGDFKFLFKGVSPSSLSETIKSNISVSQNVFGKPIEDNLGVQQETIVLSCKLVAGHHRNRQGNITQLKKMQSSGDYFNFSYFDDGVKVAGKYTIEEISKELKGIDEKAKSEIINLQIKLRKKIE